MKSWQGNEIEDQGLDLYVKAKVWDFPVMTEQTKLIRGRVQTNITGKRDSINCK